MEHRFSNSTVIGSQLTVFLKGVIMTATHLSIRKRGNSGHMRSQMLTERSSKCYKGPIKKLETFVFIINLTFSISHRNIQS